MGLWGHGMGLEVRDGVVGMGWGRCGTGPPGCRVGGVGRVVWDGHSVGQGW